MSKECPPIYLPTHNILYPDTFPNTKGPKSDEYLLTRQKKHRVAQVSLWGKIYMIPPSHYILYVYSAQITNITAHSSRA